MTNRFQMALTVNLIVAVVLFTSSVCFAKEKINYTTINKLIETATLQIETAYLKPTPKILGEAFVRGLINLDWTINKIENNKIIAENRGAVVKVSFLDDLVVRLEMSPIKRKGRVYKGTLSKWFDSINNFIIRELEYHYFIQQFDFDALSKPVRP